jgi:hypothetical protein
MSDTTPEDHKLEIDPEKARQGVFSGHVLAILAVSTFLAATALTTFFIATASGV